jgi:Sulfotransferase domain
VGVQRAGTTRWFDLIASHPEVAPPAFRKELHYFDRFYAGGYTSSDGTEYHRYFPRDGARKVGEWTPMYMSAPWIPRLLAATAPETRLLVLLRDPVERYLSGLQHDTGLAKSRSKEFSQLAPLEALMRGFYHAQLMGLLAHFDRSQILILQYERCVGQPLSELQRTFRFLELEETGFVPADIEAHPHLQPSKPTLDPDTREAYVHTYRDDVVSLISAFPEIDVSLWPNFAYLGD